MSVLSGLTKPQKKKGWLCKGVCVQIGMVLITVICKANKLQKFCVKK